MIAGGLRENVRTLLLFNVTGGKQDVVNVLNGAFILKAILSTEAENAIKTKRDGSSQ